MNTKKKLIILAGPTAVGKTALSIALAKRIEGEIVSADSMQIYRFMDIGSAKITREEMQGVPHHLIDVLMPQEPFHVCLFQKMAKEALRGIYQRGHIPIVTGGTGFYIQALLYDIDFSAEEEDVSIRRRLEEKAQKEGSEALHRALAEIDPVSANAIHPNNRKRVIRALEFYEQNGYPISEHNRRERQKEAAYDFYYFVLCEEREQLYRKIDARVDDMMAKGLVEEVRKLKTMGCDGDMVSMQGLGYKEILAYLNGDCSLEEAVSLIKQGTRHFAKRQLTWFRRERNVIWLEKSAFEDQESKMIDYIISKIQKGTDA